MASLSLIILSPTFFNTPLSCSFPMFADSLSSPLIILTLWLSALMISASFKILNMNNSPKLFILTVSTLCLMLILCFSSSNLLLFYFFFEGSLIPTLLLILGWGYQPERLQAGLYLMIYTITASLPLLMMIFSIFNSNFHISFILYHWFSPQLSFFSSYLSSLWWMATISAFLVKMPLFTVHLWLPKAHVEAPVAGSMVLAGILLKLGSYGLLRMAFLFAPMNFKLSPLISSIAMYGAVLTSLICLRQPDLKSLIAYSSVGHMGLLTAGLMSGSYWGLQGSLIMMIAHGICSSCMFALANMTYEITHTRSLFLTKGLLSLFPAMSFWWFILSAANMAAPPSINLISEILLLSSILYLNTMFIILISMTSFLAAAYSLYLFTSTQHGYPPSFINPTHLFSPQNYTTIFLHVIPLLMLMIKIDLSLINL
nr:NADH dehydrogenase subunit 4 [Travisia sanrikuensis]